MRSSVKDRACFHSYRKNSTKVGAEFVFSLDRDNFIWVRIGDDLPRRICLSDEPRHWFHRHNEDTVLVEHMSFRNRYRSVQCTLKPSSKKRFFKDCDRWYSSYVGCYHKPHCSMADDDRPVHICVPLDYDGVIYRAPNHSGVLEDRTDIDGRTYALNPDAFYTRLNGQIVARRPLRTICTCR